MANVLLQLKSSQPPKQYEESPRVAGPKWASPICCTPGRGPARLLKPIAQPNQPRIECLDSEPSHHERGRRVTAIPIMRSSISQTGMNQEAYLIY